MTQLTGKQERGDRLVARVLETALQEIARVGVENLSIEQVAASAGVNKTSIWRRWPTPGLLAESAIHHASDPAAAPDTGTLRGDLIEHLQRSREVCRSPAMQALLRMRFRGTFEGRVGQAIEERFRRADAEWTIYFRRAVERGELASDADIAILREIIMGSAQYFLTARYDIFDDRVIELLVDSFLDGARDRPKSAL